MTKVNLISCPILIVLKVYQSSVKARSRDVSHTVTTFWQYNIGRSHVTFIDALEREQLVTFAFAEN